MTTDLHSMSNTSQPVFIGDRTMWLTWAVGFFLIASILGLIMRLFHIWDVPVLDYRNILHAHSHLALLGWGYTALLVGIVFSLNFQPKSQIALKWLFGASVFANLGMLVSFPIQGYGPISIGFSTLHVLITYGFAWIILPVLSQNRQKTGVRMIRMAMVFQLLSTLGLWALGPIISSLGRMHELYFMSIQWFLHFQLNGWFVLGVLGLLILHFEQKRVTLPLTRFKLGFAALTVVLTYALAVTWAEPSPWAFRVNSLAVVLQLIAYSWIFRLLLPCKNQLVGISRLLLGLALASLVAKALLQALLVIPAVAVMSYTIRMYVIGFLHLVLLGVMTLGLSAFALAKGWLPVSRLSLTGWYLLLAGFVLTELLLFVQGTMIWAQQGFIPDYHLWLFLASILIPVSLGIHFYSLLREKSTSEYPLNPIHTHSNRIKIHTMKKSLLWSAGILGILLTACGGGTDQSATSTDASSEPVATEAAAPDPKGIGEIKSVDLGTGVDAALAETGKAIVDMKCTACHQLNDKRLVGPGFQGITNRRRPEWILNMITNVDVMLEQDPTAQKLLEECLTRMPNQNITQADARGILEFMRKNDEEKAGERDAASK